MVHEHDLAHDLGFQRARTVFTTIHFRGTVGFLFDQHYQRLLDAARLNFTDPSAVLHPYGKFFWKVLSEVKRAGYPESVVKIYITAGHTNGGYVKASGPPKLIVVVSPYPSPTLTPLKLKLVEAERRYAEMKITAHYGYGGLDVQRAEQDGFQEVLYFSDQQGITESVTANIFFVMSENHIVTPQHHVLKGATRQIILDHAATWSPGCVVEEVSKIVPSMLGGFKEAFITSTSRGVAGVSCIDDHRYGTGEGPVTQQICQSFLAFEDQYFKDSGA